MWLAMMVAMMLPSRATNIPKDTTTLGLPLQHGIWIFRHLAAVALGFMGSESRLRRLRCGGNRLGRAVPLILSALLIAAGSIQFTRWKMTHLLRCRSPFGCATSCPQHESSFQIGCKQGAACCICCAGPMDDPTRFLE